MKAKITEIFKSIQGEGFYQGILQVFIRFFGCHISCSYCDTPALNYQLLSVEEVLSRIELYNDYHSLSLTGGEPLLQVDFLKELCPLLKKRKKIIYLETNGILYNNLTRIINYIDIIAMDIKLPSDCQRRNYFYEHKKFLTFSQGKDVFVKIVVSLNSNFLEFQEAVAILRDSGKIPLILQPNFYERNSKELKEKMEYFLFYARKYLREVRKGQQLHKLIGVP